MYTLSDLKKLDGSRQSSYITKDGKFGITNDGGFLYPAKVCEGFKPGSIMLSRLSDNYVFDVEIALEKINAHVSAS